MPWPTARRLWREDGCNGVDRRLRGINHIRYYSDNEIGAVGDVLRTLVLENHVITMDALLTQRDVAQTIVEGGGDYVMIVKGNQPTLREEDSDAVCCPGGRRGNLGACGDRHYSEN
ncbi:MAG: transposase [Pyrinomonadaceae bacterium]|nr:transposase [Pyrinomonadaceae bacterium]